MDKIFDKSINSTGNLWKCRIDSKGTNTSCNKYPQGVFQGNSLPPLKFVIAMMSSKYISRKCCKFAKSQNKINQLISDIFSKRYKN